MVARPTNRSKVGVHRDAQTAWLFCPVCGVAAPNGLGEHIKLTHGPAVFKNCVFEAKRSGLSDKEIGKRFGVSLRRLEAIVTEYHGANLSSFVQARPIRSWRPVDDALETTTVWSFKQRGSWATHNGRYRGNWSPYIPRNIIRRYSRPGEVVLDYFCGAGTTAVEAKLLGRRCFASDINPNAIELARLNLDFTVPPRETGGLEIFEPKLSVRDALKLDSFAPQPVDLICTHPPYANIIRYTHSIPGDLSALGVEEFLAAMRRIAEMSLAVLKPGGKCAVLIGDTRSRGYVVPLGFRLIRVFLEAGFRLKELVIKRQHNCKGSGFWATSSVQHNFLLLAHEYLPIFERPEEPAVRDAVYSLASPIPVNILLRRERLTHRALPEPETTTVWLFPVERMHALTVQNVLKRYCEAGCVAVTLNESKGTALIWPVGKSLYVRMLFPEEGQGPASIPPLLQQLRDAVTAVLDRQSPGTFLVVQTKDVRCNGYLEPVAVKLEEMLSLPRLWLKEIVIVAPAGNSSAETVSSGHLDIIHEYLLVYEVR
ncbi:MAG: DNA methyltransferase [candidate division WOR-3 bacterium]